MYTLKSTDACGATIHPTTAHARTKSVAERQMTRSPSQVGCTRCIVVRLRQQQRRMVAVVQVDLGGYQRVSVKAEEMAIAVASPKPAFHDSITPNLVLRVEDRQTCPCVVPIPASKWWITNESNNSDEKKTCISPRHHPPIRSPRVGGGCVRTHQRVIIAPATTKSNDISHHLSTVSYTHLTLPTIYSV